MNRIFLLITFVLMSVFQVPCESLPGTQASYLVEVVDPSRHLLQVTLTLKSFPPGPLFLFMSPDITLRHLEGATQEGDHYRLHNPSGERKVSYTLSMNQWKNTPGFGPRGYLCSGYMLTRVPWALLLPETDTAVLYQVQFILPPDWTALTPWKEGDGGFWETDSQLFAQATFAAGRFEIKEKNLEGTQVRIAVDMAHESGFRRDLISQSFEIFSQTKKIFSAQGPELHLSVFVKPQGLQEWQYLNESGTSQGEAVGDLKNAAYQYAHRVFHTYNAFYPEGMNTQPTWFLEGVNEYFTRLAMARVRVEIPFSSLRQIYEKVYLPGRGSQDGVLMGNLRSPGNYLKEDFLAYKKGALVAALLDRELKTASGHKKDLSQVLQVLYSRFGSGKGGVVTQEILETVVDELGIGSLTSFFQKYVKTTTPLNMDTLFVDMDGDGICTLGEEWLGTQDNLPDTDGDGSSDAWEFLNYTDPREVREKPPGPVAVDGFNWEWEALKASLPEPLRFFWDDENLYLCLDFPQTPDLVKSQAPIRWYVNVDLDGDRSPDLNFAAVGEGFGDWSRFGKNLVSYDYQIMGGNSKPFSAVAQVAEFRIPWDILGRKSPFYITGGLWDTKLGKGMGSTDWILVSKKEGTFFP